MENKQEHHPEEDTKQELPLSIRRRAIDGGRIFAAAFSQSGISTCASSVAFFFFLSLIPLVILTSMILPHLGLTEAMMVHALTSVTPDRLDPMISSILREAFSMGGRIIPLSFLILVWASAAGMLALIRGLNIVYGAEERRGFFRLTLIALFYTVILLVLFISNMYLAVFGRSLRTFLYEIITDREAAQFGYESARYQIAFLISVVLLMMMYTFIPAGRRRFLHQLPGAVFTSAVFLVFSQLFSLYIGGANKYTLFYGSLSATAIFLFWLYCCFYIFLVGAYLNQYFEEQVHALDQKIRSRLAKK